MFPGEEKDVGEYSSGREGSAVKDNKISRHGMGIALAITLSSPPAHSNMIITSFVATATGPPVLAPVACAPVAGAVFVLLPLAPLTSMSTFTLTFTELPQPML